MTHLQLLQQCFPIEVARKIMRFHSHPTADIIRDLIKEFKTHEAHWLWNWETHLKYIDNTPNYYFIEWWYQSRLSQSYVQEVEEIDLSDSDNASDHDYDYDPEVSPSEFDFRGF